MMRFIKNEDSKMFTLIIEHLEPCLNKWLLKEYEIASKLFEGRTIFTNVKKRESELVLKKLGIVLQDSVTVLLKDRTDVIVLDPKAETVLTPTDLKRAAYVIIGGIMGSHPPAGRTYKFITSRMPSATARNIGRHQYTIAGAAYVLKLVESGREIGDIKYVFGLRVKKKMSSAIELEVELPYAFPIDDEGNVMLPEEYFRIIVEYVPIYEARVLASNQDVCQNE
jgi:ribosome biogenesis SPOUT family RNA methylase Rps3